MDNPQPTRGEQLHSSGPACRSCAQPLAEDLEDLELLPLDEREEIRIAHEEGYCAACSDHLMPE